MALEGSLANSSYRKASAAKSEIDSEWGVRGKDKLDTSPLRMIGDYKLTSSGI